MVGRVVLSASRLCCFPGTTRDTAPYKYNHVCCGTKTPDTMKKSNTSPQNSTRSTSKCIGEKPFVRRWHRATKQVSRQQFTLLQTGCYLPYEQKKFNQKDEKETRYSDLTEGATGQKGCCLADKGNCARRDKGMGCSSAFTNVVAGTSFQGSAKLVSRCLTFLKERDRFVLPRRAMLLSTPRSSSRAFSAGGSTFVRILRLSRIVVHKRGSTLVTSGHRPREASSLIADLKVALTTSTLSAGSGPSSTLM